MAERKSDVDERIYKLMVEQSKDYALFVLDPEGHIATWNAGAERIKGYRAEEIIGKHFSVFYTPDAIQRAWPQHELKVATAEGHFEDEGWRIRKDGSRFWASVAITALRDEDGKLLGFSKITRDLSERKKQEEALRQSEERFRLLIESVVDYAIFMLDTEGVVASWNIGAQAIKGYSRTEIIGKHFSTFYTQDDLDHGKPWELLALARRSGKAEDEGWRVKKNGDRFWARVVLTAIYDSDGHLRGFAKITQDLSERRYIQDLEKAARNVNEFIATLAHELRNPLAPIRSAVQMMAKIAHDDTATQQKLREMIDRQSAHLVRIVDDMVDIARISRGSLQLERQPVDVKEAVRRAIETSTPVIDACNHSLHVEMPQEILPVEGDLSRLTQLLTNLLNNAARYTPQGGRITVHARAAGSAAVVTVHDTGRGIAPQLKDQIFDMFVQGEPPLQRVGAGLGVGLALARKIAEMHGGTLEAHSEGANRGSEFTLRVPLAPMHAASIAPELIADATMPVRKRVLVVDDNVDVASSLSMLLRSLGHETAEVHNGVDAIRQAVEFRPDVVLLDIGMEGLNGYEVARRLRGLKKDRHFLLVAVTGWGQDADRVRSSEAGFDLHLVKPVELEVLADAVMGRNGASLH